MTSGPPLQPSPPAAIARVLSAAIGVAPTYQHVPKHVTPGDPVELPAALLKAVAAERRLHDLYRGPA